MRNEKDSKSKMESIEGLFLKAYDENAESILKHIYFRVNSRNLAEDLTSETFLKTWQSVRQGAEIENLRAFLYRVANNLIIDHYRAKSKIAVPLEDIAEPADPKEDRADERMDVQIEMKEVERHLADLPPDYRQIIIYRYIDELSISEIRKLTGKSAANIYVIIHRALKALKRKLSREENPFENK